MGTDFLPCSGWLASEDFRLYVRTGAPQESIGQKEDCRIPRQPVYAPELNHTAHRQ